MIGHTQAHHTRPRPDRFGSTLTEIRESLKHKQKYIAAYFVNQGLRDRGDQARMCEFERYLFAWPWREGEHGSPIDELILWCACNHCDHRFPELDALRSTRIAVWEGMTRVEQIAYRRRVGSKELVPGCAGLPFAEAGS